MSRADGPDATEMRERRSRAFVNDHVRWIRVTTGMGTPMAEIVHPDLWNFMSLDVFDPHFLYERCSTLSKASQCRDLDRARDKRWRRTVEGATRDEQDAAHRRVSTRDGKQPCRPSRRARCRPILKLAFSVQCDCMDDQPISMPFLPVVRAGRRGQCGRSQLRSLR
jgi:hypothetical protein